MLVLISMQSSIFAMQKNKTLVSTEEYNFYVASAYYDFVDGRRKPVSQAIHVHPCDSHSITVASIATFYEYGPYDEYSAYVSRVTNDATYLAMHIKTRPQLFMRNFEMSDAQKRCLFIMAKKYPSTYNGKEISQHFLFLYKGNN